MLDVITSNKRSFEFISFDRNQIIESLLQVNKNEPSTQSKYHLVNRYSLVALRKFSSFIADLFMPFN